MNGIDNLFSGMRASSSGLTAERTRMDIIAENIANARTTRTPGGGPYRRRLVQFEPILRKVAGGGTEVTGVRAARIVADRTTPFQVIHDPSHPDRDANGFVRLPNVNMVMEMADLISSVRAYEANLTVQQNFMQMAERALQIAR